MSELKWIKLAVSMFDDEKITFIESLPESDAILIIWIKLLTMAGKCNAGGYILLTEKIPYTPEMLAHKFKKPLNTVKLALQTFQQLDMLCVDENGIFLANWEKHQNIDGLEKIREQAKIRKQKQREKEKQKLLSCHVTSHKDVTPSHATELEQDLELEIDNIINLELELNVSEDEAKSSVQFDPKRDQIKITEDERKRLFGLILSLGAKNNQQAQSYLNEKILQLIDKKKNGFVVEKTDFAVLYSWIKGDYKSNRPTVVFIDKSDIQRPNPPDLAEITKNSNSEPDWGDD